MDLQGRKCRRRGIIGRVARHICVVVICSALIPGGSLLFASAPATPATDQAASQTIPPEQLDALVAPIALYPDNLLAQVLVAST